MDKRTAEEAHSDALREARQVQALADRLYEEVKRVHGRTRAMEMVRDWTRVTQTNVSAGVADLAG